MWRKSESSLINFTNFTISLVKLNLSSSLIVDCKNVLVCGSTFQMRINFICFSPEATSGAGVTKYCLCWRNHNNFYNIMWCIVTLLTFCLQRNTFFSSPTPQGDISRINIWRCLLWAVAIFPRCSNKLSAAHLECATFQCCRLTCGQHCLPITWTRTMKFLALLLGCKCSLISIINLIWADYVWAYNLL